MNNIVSEVMNYIIITSHQITYCDIKNIFLYNITHKLLSRNGRETGTFPFEHYELKRGHISFNKFGKRRDTTQKVREVEADLE